MPNISAKKEPFIVTVCLCLKLGFLAILLWLRVCIILAIQMLIATCCTVSSPARIYYDCALHIVCLDAVHIIVFS